MSFESKDDVGLILMGTQESDNPLATEGGQFSNIAYARELSPADLELLDVMNYLQPTNYVGSLNESIELAGYIFNLTYNGKKTRRKVLIFSSGEDNGKSSPHKAKEVIEINDLKVKIMSLLNKRRFKYF